MDFFRVQILYRGSLVSVVGLRKKIGAYVGMTRLMFKHSIVE